jgi:hypothetical protein
LLSNIRKYVKPKLISRQNKNMTQQHNWRKSSSSPRKAIIMPLTTSQHSFAAIWQKKKVPKQKNLRVGNR